MKYRLIGFLVLLIGLVSLMAYAQAPVPLINLPLVPDATAPGGAAFTLTVSGTGFVSNSVVDWNGSTLSTTFVNNSQLTAAAPAAEIATAGTAWVTVVNPEPGGGTSNVAFFTVTVDPGMLIGFGLPSSTAIGSGPVSMAAGDFNGDGNQDLAVVNSLDNTISILLGDGTGNFTLAPSPATGSAPQSVAVGDFNGDGKLDLAVANGGSNTVSILLGDGTGNFTLASSPTTGIEPASVAVGDFKGDGKLDLAVANYWSYTVSILLGDGAGNFTLASTLVIGTFPVSVGVGDFNGDSKLDLAVATQPLCGGCGNGIGIGTVSIFLGDGTGNFTLASAPTAGSYPRSVSIGDFNRDGRLDVAVADFWDSVSILLQVPPNPEGTLFPASLNFGNQNVGTSSAPQIATFTNSSSGSITMTGISITGANSGDYSQTNTCGPSLAAGASCSITVTFKPTALGTRSATLNVTDSSPSSPQTSSLTGTGTQPAVTLTPTSLTFPVQLINTASASLTVTLTNTGSGTLTITSFGVAGPFSQTNWCGSILTPGGICTISVVFQPTSEGTATGSVTITDNAPGSPQVIGLTGHGFGRPALSGRIVSQSKSGTTVTATLQVTDGGTGAADQVWMNQIALRTLSGTGTVTLSGPPLPVSVGNVAIQGSTDVTLNVPATVTKFSLTEKGTLQNIAGGSFNFGVAEVMYP